MRFTAEAEGLVLGDRVMWIGLKATEWSLCVASVTRLVHIRFSATDG